MMHLYLVRHGIAVEREDFKEGPDSSRPLTGKGRKRFEKAARAFARRAEKLDLILTSPLVRAVQTAEILAAAAKHGEVRVQAELAPETDVPALLAAVGRRAAKGSVALVGHEPLLSRALAALAHLTPEEAAKLDFKKGSIVRIDVSDLPAAKSSTPRFWLKPRSGARVEGLPLLQPAQAAAPAARKVKSKAKPAPARKAGAAKKAQAATKTKVAKSSKDAKKPERAPGKTTAQAAQPRSAPRRAARRAAKPAAAAPNQAAGPASAKPSAPSAQSFMGSPRPAPPEAPHADGAATPQSDERA